MDDNITRIFRASIKNTKNGIILQELYKNKINERIDRFLKIKGLIQNYISLNKGKYINVKTYSTSLNLETYNKN